MATHLKFVIERHADGYVAYPLGLARGAVVGQGDSYETALADVRSAVAFYAETFGPAANPIGQRDRAGDVPVSFPKWSLRGSYFGYSHVCDHADLLLDRRRAWWTVVRREGR